MKKSRRKSDQTQPITQNPLKIGFDARVVGRYPGLGRYAKNLLEALAPMTREWTWNVFVESGKADLLNLPNGNIRIFKGPPPISWRTPMLFSGKVDRRKLDLFHSTFQVAPYRMKTPYVVTVHDMMDLDYREAFDHHSTNKRALLKFYFKRTVPQSIAQARRIITPSIATKNDLLRLFPEIAPVRVSVIYEAAGAQFTPGRNMNKFEEIRKKYNIPKRYILYLGSTKHYKNPKGVIDGFALLLRIADTVTLPNLVIAGLKHVDKGELRTYALQKRIGNYVSFPGRIEEEDLPDLYRHAEFFVFPSFREGFGLPVIEAMACGCPVIVSNRSALPELVGDAGMKVEPGRPESIAAGMAALIRDVKGRDEFSRKGIERAEAFSWERAARETIDVYRKVLVS